MRAWVLVIVALTLAAGGGAAYTTLHHPVTPVPGPGTDATTPSVHPTSSPDTGPAGPTSSGTPAVPGPDASLVDATGEPTSYAPPAAPLADLPAGGSGGAPDAGPGSAGGTSDPPSNDSRLDAPPSGGGTNGGADNNTDPPKAPPPPLKRTELVRETHDGTTGDSGTYFTVASGYDHLEWSVLIHPMDAPATVVPKMSIDLYSPSGQVGDCTVTPVLTTAQACSTASISAVPGIWHVGYAGTGHVLIDTVVTAVPPS